MSLHFTTESGAHYEIRQTVPPVNAGFAAHPGIQHLRRLDEGGAPAKRADGDWIQVHSHTPIEVGQRVVLVAESLAHLGPDDEGIQDLGSTVTTRHTTHVTRVWEES